MVFHSFRNGQDANTFQPAAQYTTKFIPAPEKSHVTAGEPWDRGRRHGTAGADMGSRA